MSPLTRPSGKAGLSLPGLKSLLLMASCSAWFLNNSKRPSAFISPPPLGRICAFFSNTVCWPSAVSFCSCTRPLLFAVPVSNCHAVSGASKPPFTVISPLRLPLRFCLSASAATISCSSSAKSSACLSVLMLPESLSCPFFSNCAVRSEMVIKPSSFTVNSPSKVRTGMPPASAGAAALLSKSIEPSSAKPSANAGTTVASKSSLASGRPAIKACGLMPSPLIWIWSIFSFSFSANGCSMVSALRLMPLPERWVRAPTSCKLPLKRTWFSTLMSSSTPVLSKAPLSANGVCRPSVMRPADTLQGVCRSCTFNKCC